MGINISSPVPGDSLPSSTCYASGTSDPNVPIYAALNNFSINTSVPGMLVSLPPNFVFQFQNAPVGAGYTLIVRDTENPPNCPSVGNLTVIPG